MNLSSDAKKLILLLSNAGYCAYAVGGCVRDSLMGKVPKDIDITTSALPLDIENILYNANIKYFETGIKHGTITALVNNNPYEITTFRCDGEYRDNRHPDNVSFVNDITLDLARRDFTINAIAYNDEDGIIDLYDGKKDIKNKIIRAVGNPDKRFNEDALRIMRALRFSSVLGFEIEEETSNAIFRNKNLLNNIATERIYVELMKLLCGDNVENVLTKYRDVIAVIIPEIEPCFDCSQNGRWHLYDVYTHIVKSVAVCKNVDYLRFTMLLHDIGKPYVKFTDKNGNDHFKTHPKKSYELTCDILKRFKVSNDVFRKVSTMVLIHDEYLTLDVIDIKNRLRKLGDDLMLDFVEVRIADLSTHNLAYAEDKYDNLLKIRQITREIIESGEPYKINDLAIKGNELIPLGYKGCEIANELERLITLVSADKTLNDKKYLIEQAKKDRALY